MEEFKGVVTQRTNPRADAINASVDVRAAALVKQVGDPVGMTEGELKLERERALAFAKTELLRGHVHILCREIENLTCYLRGRLVGDSTQSLHDMTVQLHGRPVMLVYRVDEDGVWLERANGLDAHTDAGIFTESQIEEWRAACERDRRDEVRLTRDSVAIEGHIARQQQWVAG